jgi:peptidoglycan/LPS O-acetylase OafA/YrhL
VDPRPERRGIGTNTSYRPDIQGLRGIAVLLVVLFHAGVGPRAGFLGVDVFFVISGVVIGQRLFDELSGTGTIRLRSFYGRRVRRLLPAMALFTVVTAVGTALVLSPFGPQQFALRTGAAATVLIGNVHLYRHTGYFDGSAERNPFLHTWSLSVEEQFYLVLPAVLALVWVVGRRVVPRRSQRSVTAAVVALVAVWSFGLAWVLTAGSATFGAEAPERLAFFAMPARIWEFAAGVLLALGLRSWRRPPVLTAAVLGAGGLLAVLVASVVLDPDAPHPAGWALVTVAGTTALIGAGGHGSPVDRLLSSRPLVWLGDVSYGWYLWHWPLIVFARLRWPDSTTALVVAAVVSLIPTVLSYRFVERPIRFEPRWVGGRTVALAAGCVLVPLVVVGSLNWGASGRWGLEEPAGWYDNPPGFDAGCHLINRDAVNTPPGEDCRFGPADAPGTVMVVGDQSADGLTPAIVEAAGSAGLATLQWSRAGCPFLDGRAPLHYERCAEWQAQVRQVIDAEEPVLVVIANQSVDYTDDLVFTVPDGPQRSGASAVDSYRDGLAAALDELAEAGVPVVVVSAVPDFGDRFPRGRLSVLDPEPAVPELAVTEVDRWRAEALRVEREVTGAHDRLELVDPVPVLCSAVCTPVRDGEWLYLGPVNLTNAGSRLLTDELERVIAGLLG